MLTASDVYSQIGQLYHQLDICIGEKMLLQKQMRCASVNKEIDHRRRLNNNRETLALRQIKDSLYTIIEGQK
jgi:hypothetical protein